MAKRVLVSVGGTGQMVLHYYTQLYLLGLISEPFEGLVLDSDDLNPGLAVQQDYLNKIASATQEPVAKITYIRVQTDAAGATNVCGALTGHSNFPTFHPVHAFFDQDTLSTGISKGLYARPALSTLIAFDPVEFESAFGAESHGRVVVVGSLIGGTGGGIIAPVIARAAALIAQRHLTGTSLRAVLLGSFFEPNRDLFPEADQRFESNKILAAKTLQQLAPTVFEKFVFIEPAVKAKRGNEQQDNQPWPASDHGYWLAVQAAEKMFVDNIAPASQNFNAREFTANYTDLLPHSVAYQELVRKFSIAQEFLRRKVLASVADEPFVRAVWGKRLPSLVEAYYRPASQKAEVLAGAPSRFAKDMHDGVADSWSKLRKALPLVRDAVPVSAARIRNAEWGELTSSPPPGLFGSLQEGEKAAAAYVLFRLLRGGQA